MTLPTISRRWLKVAGVMSVLAVMAAVVGVVGSSSVEAQSPGFTITSGLGPGFTSSFPKTTGFQTNRLFRDGFASSCFNNKPNPGLFHTTPPIPQYRYDQYVIRNQVQQATCVTITQSASCAGQTFIAAYRNTFSPANPALNYLGDPGSSTSTGGAVTFSVVVPPFSNLVLVTHEVTVGAGCSFYQIQVSGIPPVQ